MILLYKYLPHGLTQLLIIYWNIKVGTVMIHPTNALTDSYWFQNTLYCNEIYFSQFVLPKILHIISEKSLIKYI